MAAEGAAVMTEELNAHLAAGVISSGGVWCSGWSGRYHDPCRNEVQSLFRRLKVFRRRFSRIDKLDVMFLASLHFARIVEVLLQW